ncbi:sulfate transporter family-domain-containing protein [Roridomyces roridus]|uniref:Sulfate transporter family-domain-containing protein n=1 Tax=Roridomyces roridus TaxID=1738132 RepID=A0AAD7B7L3_9AGAR|nr:sulfate transporter family-domain-containing protein [Roridomyces roridus]
MDVVKQRSSRFIQGLPARLYRALPAVILGSLFNILDAVSIGVLIFPSAEGVFRTLQLQGLSMFIMSTIVSQVVMTAGGSRFAGGIGATLIEIFPFLRGVATDIIGALGDGHPGLIPTVMAAYAVMSFLTGFVWLLLGVLRLGTVVAYFPQTVLTGAVGAVGVSLFILGLGLPFPASSPPLSLHNVASTLFAQSHLALFAASFFPAVVLSLTLRSRWADKLSRGLVSSAYFIPLYLLCIPIVFWVIAVSLHLSKEGLVAAGWLFTMESSATSADQIVSGWNYWSLFNFKLVEWSALKSATQNIALLVVIGVLNLPIFVPALGLALDVSYDMNHELIGQGLANILAGAVGTAPNILQFSYSVYFTRAKGDRFELWIVVLVTTGLFFSAGSLLPYVPTILASAMVLFLGIELFLEAAWEASKTLSAMEWAVVMATLIACTFLGFAEGFGVGIGAATVVYLAYGVIDSPAKARECDEWRDALQEKSALRLATPSVAERQDQPSSTTTESTLALAKSNARVVILSGYIFFASIPSMEKKLLNFKADGSEIVILDLSGAHRMETTAARCLTRCVGEIELKKGMLVICGIVRNSGLHADLVRAEVSLAFDPEERVGDDEKDKPILVFATRSECVEWCGRQTAAGDVRVGNDSDNRQSTFEKFCLLFDFDPTLVLRNELPQTGTAATDADLFIQNGGRITTYFAGQVIQPDAGIVFVVDGRIALRPQVAATDNAGHTTTRPSLRNFLATMPKEAGKRFEALLSARSSMVGSGDVVDLGDGSNVGVVLERSVVIEVVAGPLVDWARGKVKQ